MVHVFLSLITLIRRFCDCRHIMISQIFLNIILSECGYLREICEIEKAVA